MKWNVLIATGALAAFAGSSYAQTMDPLHLRSLAASCANCHGTHGVAEAGNESLAGANKDEMLKKMLDFKTGKKPATIMHQLSKGYTDEQLAALATYFSSLKK
jgi:cytochrome c553